MIDFNREKRIEVLMGREEKDYRGLGHNYKMGVTIKINLRDVLRQ